MVKLKFIPRTTLNVSLRFGEEVFPIGRLAQREEKIYFAYDEVFLQKSREIGMEISPLPLSGKGRGAII